MVFFRRLLILAICLTTAGTFLASAAFAARSVWAKGGQPICTVILESPAASSTMCTGTMSGENGVQFVVNLEVTGAAVYQCQDATGATTAGQNHVLTQAGSAASFTPTKQNETFTIGPADLAAPSAVSATQAGCADGAVPVDPALTTTRIQLWLAPQGDSTILANCASDPDGMSGTISLTTC